MIRLISFSVLLSLGLAAPALADNDPIDWRSLFSTGTGQRGVPLQAPPVVIAPPPALPLDPYPTHRRRSLPAACLDSVETPDGWRRFYDEGCLASFERRASDLPQSCRVRLLTWGDVRRGFDPACLRDAGYRQGR